MSYKSVPQEFPTRVAHKSVLQSVPQECPTRVSFGHISFSIVFAFGFVGSILFFWGGAISPNFIFAAVGEVLMDRDCSQQVGKNLGNKMFEQKFVSKMFCLLVFPLLCPSFSFCFPFPYLSLL